MKLKSSLILFLAFIAFTNLSAQESSEDSDSTDVDCRRELSVFAQSAKVKEYDSAKKHYDKLIAHCPPDMHAAIYQYGQRMFKSLMDETDDEDKKKEYAEGLIKNYKRLDKYFPDKARGNIASRIAQLKYDNDIGSKEEQYEAFNKAWHEDPESFNDPKGLYTYFSLLVDLQDDGKKDLEDVFKVYDRVINKIKEEESMRAEEQEELRNKKDSIGKISNKEKRTMHNDSIYLRNYVKIRESIDEKIGSRADCDNLVPLYAEKYDDNKEDEDWLQRAAHRLSAKKCTSGEEGELFFKITERLNDMNPSSKTAKYLGQLAEQDGKIKKALKYYKQSADLEDNKLDKAKAYYLIANMYNKRGGKSRARSYYRKALSNDQSLGAAHLKIAELYASSANDCGDDTFDKRAVYWLAAKEADRAAQVDPSLRSTAQQSAESYRAHAPSKSDIFKKGNQGETISVKCWIHDKVKVPSL